jgi:hypothetical protein
MKDDFYVYICRITTESGMYSKLVFFIPIISLIYVLQTFFFKSIRRVFRIPLLILAVTVFLFDLFTASYFFTACYEMVVTYGYDNCLNWIYPTLDFKIMVAISVLLITLALWALVHEWKRLAFYMMGAIVFYLGLVLRLMVFIQSISIISNIGSVSAPIIFEFFTIIVVYGLVSAGMYFTIFFFGLLRPRTLPQHQG